MGEDDRCYISVESIYLSEIVHSYLEYLPFVIPTYTKKYKKPKPKVFFVPVVIYLIDLRVDLLVVSIF